MGGIKEGCLAHSEQTKTKSNLTTPLIIQLISIIAVFYPKWYNNLFIRTQLNRTTSNNSSRMSSRASRALIWRLQRPTSSLPHLPTLTRQLSETARSLSSSTSIPEAAPREPSTIWSPRMSSQPSPDPSPPPKSKIYHSLFYLSLGRLCSIQNNTSSSNHPWFSLP